MEKLQSKYKRYIWVCENIKDKGACCGAVGEKLRPFLKEKVKDLGLGDQIRVSRSGCQGACVEGPNLLIEPEQIWFKGIKEEDFEGLVGEITKGFV